MAMVEVSQLRKKYPGGVEAVRGIDFDVQTGEVFGLLGPNGAGKSTTIGMLTTTIKPTAGTAVLAGHDVVRRPLDARAVSSVVFQEPVDDRSLSGRVNLELHANLWGVERRRRLSGSRKLHVPSGSPSSSTARSRATAAGSDVASRSRGRLSRGRASCSSTSRRWASIRASGSSCSGRSPRFESATR